MTFLAIPAPARAGFARAAATLAACLALAGGAHAQLGPRAPLNQPAQPASPGAPFATKPVPTLPAPARPTLPPARTGFVDRIVAVVNNEVITQKELDERVRLVALQLQAQRVPLPPIDVLERQVLERMITDRVQVQFALETGLRIDDLQLDRTLGMMAEQNRMS
ncbi:MAG: SurA N-terminal domain-containing protein, partial [Burkholderiales bacterium]|nr:SurA N-terminal domain-containing protein [Burkholderiales bacterium]